MSNFIQYHSSKLHYQKHKGGDKTVLIFHGFGHTHQDMNKISDLFVQAGYTVYSFDLYYHGKSFKDYSTKPIHIEEFKHIISLFINREKLQKFELLSYSIGSRFALTITYLFSGKIKALYLLAPDSICLSSVYRFSTSTFIGKTLFKLITKSSIVYKMLIATIGKLGIINASTIRFAKNQMKTVQERNKIFYTWMSFSKLYQSFQDVVNLMNKHHIDYHLFLGKYDRIIPSKKLIQKSQSIHQKTIYLYDMGHTQLLHSKQTLKDLSNIIK